MEIDALTLLCEDHIVGVISENRIKEYYLCQGCNVYNPEVRQGKTDFIVEWSDHRLERIQVKTATWSKVGNKHYLQCRVLSSNKNKILPCDGYYEVLATVDGDDLWMIPAKEINKATITLRKGEAFNEEWLKYKKTRQSLITEFIEEEEHINDQGKDCSQDYCS